MDSQLHAVCTQCNAVNRIPAQRDGKEINCGKCHQPLFGGEPPSVNHAGFSAQLTRSDVPVVVDFWAPWCGPCKMLKEELKKVNSSTPIYKIDVEEDINFSREYSVRSVPTMKMFKEGSVVNTTVGLRSAPEINKLITESV